MPFNSRYSEVQCPSLELPFSHKEAPGSPIQPNHFTATWPAFFGDKKKRGTTQASLSCCTPQDPKEKSLKMRRSWMSFVVCWMLFTTKGTAGTYWADCGATHCEMQILLLQLVIHENWIWAFSQLTYSCAHSLSLITMGASTSMRHLYLSLDHSVSKLENANGVDNHISYLSCWTQLAELSLVLLQGNDLHATVWAKNSMFFLLFQSLSCKFCCRDEGIAPCRWGTTGSPEQFTQPRWRTP